VSMRLKALGKAPASPVQAVPCFSFVNSFVAMHACLENNSTSAGFLRESTIASLAMIPGLSKERCISLQVQGIFWGWGPRAQWAGQRGHAESTLGSAVPHIWENQES